MNVTEIQSEICRRFERYKIIVAADKLGFGVLGFFTVYLMTRLFISGAFSRAEAFLARAVARARNLVNLDLGDLGDLEKTWLKKILKAHKQGTDHRISKDFARESKDHQALRLLKDRFIIRPRGGGSWRTGKVVEFTPIAEQIIDKLEEASKEAPRDASAV